MTLFQLAAPLMLASLLGACAVKPHSISEVSRFNDLGGSAAERTVAVAPLDEARRADLEFRDYAIRVEFALREQGFRPPAADAAQPDLVAFINYGIDGGTEITTTAPRYRYEPCQYRTYTGHIRTAAGLQPYVITSFTPGRHIYAGERKVTRTEYRAFLTLDLVDRATLGDDTPRKVFEGRVLTLSRRSMLPAVMPAMVRALFHKFPGTNGESYTLPAFDRPAN